MRTMLEAALDYAGRGWRVFPLHGIVNGRCTCGRPECSSPGKHPLVSRGLHEATTDAGVVGEWWRQWRSANIGVATGAGSGVVVVDVDLPAALASLGPLADLRLPPTLTGLTGGGGIHLVFSSNDEVLGNSAGRLPGLDVGLPGVDLRGNGGYIVVPPSAHQRGARYEWLDPDVVPVPAPDWLKEPERPTVELAAVTPVTFSGDGTAYGRAALDSALASLRQAPVGQRNHTLNRVTFSLAQLVGGGELLESAVRKKVYDAALGIGLKGVEALQTMNSAFSAGLSAPRVAPHRIMVPTTEKYLERS